MPVTFMRPLYRCDCMILHVAPYWQNPSNAGNWCATWYKIIANPWNLLGSRANCAIKDRWASTVKSKVPAFKEAHISPSKRRKRVPVPGLFSRNHGTIILRQFYDIPPNELLIHCMLKEKCKIWRYESLTSLWQQYQHYYRTFEEMVHMCPQCSQASAGLSLARLQREWAS